LKQKEGELVMSERPEDLEKRCRQWCYIIPWTLGAIYCQGKIKQKVIATAASLAITSLFWNDRWQFPRQFSLTEVNLQMMTGPAVLITAAAISLLADLMVWAMKRIASATFEVFDLFGCI